MKDDFELVRDGIRAGQLDSNSAGFQLSLIEKERADLAIDRIKAENEWLRRAADVLSQSYSAERETVERLLHKNNMLHARERDCEELEAEVERLREYEAFAAQTHDAVTKLGEAREEIERLSGQLGSENARANTLAGELTAARAEVERLRERVERFEHGNYYDRLFKAEQEVEQLRVERDNAGFIPWAGAQDALVENSVIIRQLRDEVERLQEELKNTTLAWASQVRELAKEVEQSRADLKGGRAQAIEQRNRAEAEVEQLRAELANTVSPFAASRLVEENVRLDGALFEATQSITTLEDENDRLRAELAEVKRPQEDQWGNEWGLDVPFGTRPPGR